MLRNILLALGFTLIIALGYFLFFRGGSNPPLTSSSSDQAGSDLLIQDQAFLGRLQKLQMLKMDTTILNNERFVSLHNFRRELVDERTGRPNPFLPVGQ